MFSHLVECSYHEYKALCACFRIATAHNTWHSTMDLSGNRICNIAVYIMRVYNNGCRKPQRQHMGACICVHSNSVCDISNPLAIFTSHVSLLFTHFTTARRRANWNRLMHKTITMKQWNSIAEMSKINAIIAWAKCVLAVLSPCVYFISS